MILQKRLDGLAQTAARPTEHANNFGKRRCRRRTDGGILVLQQVLRFGRPGHQFTIETKPVACELSPEIGARQRLSNLSEHLALDTRILEKSPAGARVDDSGAFITNSKPFERDRFIPAY